LPAEKSSGHDGMKDSGVVRGRWAAGRYLVAGGPQARALGEWIAGRGFEQYADEAHRLKRHGRRRNKLYSFRLPVTGSEVIMKVFRIDPRYRRGRKADLLVRQLLGRDYNRNAFLCCLAMRRAGLPVARPLAWWSWKQKGLFGGSSVFLYEKIAADRSLDDFCRAIRENSGGDAGRLLNAVKRKLARELHRMHSAGIRHRDPQAINILVDAPPSGEPEQATFHFIDYDSCSRTRVAIQPIRKFFDIRDLCVIYQDEFGPHDLLDLYPGCERTALWHTVLRFWQHGGFAPWRSTPWPGIEKARRMSGKKTR